MSWGGGDMMRDFLPGALVGALLVLLLWQAMKPAQTFTIYDGRKVDSLKNEIELRRDTIGYLFDSIAWLQKRDSVVWYEFQVYKREKEKKIESVPQWTDKEIDDWLCKNYGLCR